MAIRGILLDLDGTVYRGEEEVPGASEFINGLKSQGIRHLFVTNRANRTPAEVCDHLRGYGIACEESDVLTSGQAAALYMKEGTYYHIGEKGLEAALAERGLAFDDVSPDFVVVSFDRDFTYAKLETACRLIEKGARFIATNPDRALKVPGGILPGTGAIVAAVAAGSDAEPVYIGKPERLILDIALERLGMHKDEVITVGDNIFTDIPAGSKAGLRTALILTGVSTREDLDAAIVEPTWVVAGYEELDAIVRRQP